MLGEELHRLCASHRRPNYDDRPYYGILSISIPISTQWRDSQHLRSLLLPPSPAHLRSSEIRARSLLFLDVRKSQVKASLTLLGFCSLTALFNEGRSRERERKGQLARAEPRGRQRQEGRKKNLRAKLATELDLLRIVDYLRWESFQRRSDALSELCRELDRKQPEDGEDIGAGVLPSFDQSLQQQRDQLSTRCLHHTSNRGRVSGVGAEMSRQVRLRRVELKSFVADDGAEGIECCEDDLWGEEGEG